MKILFYTACLYLLIGTLSPLGAQDIKSNYWELRKSPTSRSLENSYLGSLPNDFIIAVLNKNSFQSVLNKAISIDEQGSEDQSLTISLPTPDGSFLEFQIYENSVIAPEVQHLYSIKTYKGFSSQVPQVQIRCDISDIGFHAFIYDGENSYAIEPYLKNDEKIHIVYYKDNLKSAPLKCDFQHEPIERNKNRNNINYRAPSNLRTFELAYVASGEYSQQFGGMPYSTTNVLNSFASALNLVNPIYEGDLGITFTLVSTAALVFENPATDPFDPFGNQVTLIVQNQTECDNALGSTNYDIGHLLVWANTGGLASSGVVCFDPQKGEGFSGNNTSFTTLIVDYSCHEIGHQFNADHNFASQECGTSANGFRYEPGEGSSIMSYAGVCGAPASYQGFSNQYFHSASINVMNQYITDFGGCETTSTPGSGNASDPIANAQSNITIPKQTPFILVGSATDGNDPTGQLSYLWEQYDGAGSAVTGSPDCMSTDAPLFKYRDPVFVNYRIFPEMNEVLTGNNNGSSWEKLPCIARNINFNLIVRDNNSNWGRTGNNQMIVTVANTGPFEVVSPNGGETWNEGNTQTVTWNVNGTDAHCANVDILLSTDNGTTFSVIGSAVPNDGSQDITVPSGLTSTARILIQCSVGGNFRSASTFFDASDGVFNIETALPVELVYFQAEKVLDHQVKLQWTTASEVKNDRFEIERSQEGSDFQHINTVYSKGNSLSITHYSIMDKNPLSGNNFYRLKQVDLDGSYKYSNMELVSIEGNERIRVYPNPATDLLTIEVPQTEGDIPIAIYDQLGRLVRKTRMTSGQLDLKEISDGIYFISIVSNHYHHLEKVMIKHLE